MKILEFGNSNYSYKWWNGEKLKSSADSPMAFDVETTLLRPYREPIGEEKAIDIPTDPRHIPTPTLGMCYDGSELVLIHPNKFGKFFKLHNSDYIVGHNLQFDWWSCYSIVDKATQEILWTLAEKNRLCDTLVLDLLLQLGTGKLRYGSSDSDDAKLYPTNLGQLAKEWEVGTVDKKDEYRLRFGELLEKTEEEIDSNAEASNFYSYALKDVIVTYRVYQKQRKAGIEIMKKAGWSPTPKKTYEISPTALRDYGVLTEYIQVNASIALAQLSRTPLKIDTVRRAETEKLARERYNNNLKKLLEVEPELVKTYKEKSRAGEVKFTKQSSLPQFNQKKLVEVLEKEAVRLNITIPKSDGILKGISLSTKAWQHLSQQSEFIAAWVELERDSKLLEFLVNLDGDKIYSRYNLMMMNGRTSCAAHKYKKELLLKSINIQQIPRQDPNHPERSVRGLFIAEKGTKWLTCDYSFIELRGVAASCRARFGYSKLAETIEEYEKDKYCDPHQKMAAATLGVTVEEFFKLPKDDQKRYRQASKPVSFGNSGGLGFRKFIDYAKGNYGVTYTTSEAKKAKKVWLELYPEMKLHLADQTQKALEWNTGKRQPNMEWFEKKRLSDFVRGGEKERSEYSEQEQDFIWNKLKGFAKDKKDAAMLESIDNGEITREIRNLFTYRVCTMTGRVRNFCKFTDSCNNVFSSLCADGCKIAMFNLMRRGFKILSFIHDSFDIEISANPTVAASQVKVVRKIMIDSMEKVFNKLVPANIDYSVGDRWAK